MFNHILAPLDGSSLAESVMPWIMIIARAMEARITLFRVLEISKTGGCAPPIDPLEWKMCKVEVESYLKMWIKRLQDKGLEAEYVIQEGDPAHRIIEFVNSHDVDLIAACSHGRSGLAGWNLGSVIHKVVSRARISVMIARAHKPAAGYLEDFPVRKVLVLLDGSKRSEYVLAPLNQLIRSHDTQIILAHAVRKPEIPRYTPLSKEDLELSNRITDRNRQEAQKRLKLFQSRLTGNIHTRVLVSDDVATSLHKLAHDESVDLVALSAHGYSGKTKWAYGSVANSFIDYGDTPLLIVQDFPREKVEPTWAETVVRERKGH